MELIHHGGHRGVTGSCHQLKLEGKGESVLVDCGLFQGRDADEHQQLDIDFPLDGITHLLLTHVHIDHVGRLPYLLGAGFRGKIVCSRPTAKLLPLVIEDALKIGFTKNKRLISKFQRQVSDLLQPLRYGHWETLNSAFQVRLRPAGHILGSTSFEVETAEGRVVFSGDLGAPHAPLLKDAVPPERADLLVLESTYGDRIHTDREQRQERLETILRHTLRDKGITIIPAFSLGRTQELLYEMNSIFERIQQESGRSLMKQVDVIVDSPLATKFTEVYEDLRPYWDEEAQQVLEIDDQPLVFDNLTTIDDHDQHQGTLKYLARKELPAIVIAGSGMCTGGRVVNYLREFVDKPTTDIVFVGYQAAGTTGRVLQSGNGRVRIHGKELDVDAKIHTLSGYSAHADQQDLINFVTGMQEPPKEIVLVHGEPEAQEVLRNKLRELGYQVRD